MKPMLRGYIRCSHCLAEYKPHPKGSWMPGFCQRCANRQDISHIVISDVVLERGIISGVSDGIHEKTRPLSGSRLRR